MTIQELKQKFGIIGNGIHSDKNDFLIAMVAPVAILKK